MECYLTDTLQVSADHIRTLRDGEATRSTIIKEFTNLQNDPRIREGDAIIIFYAGHGGETTAPPGWESEGSKIQYILPCDIKTKDNNGSDIHGIPDRTLASLLKELSIAKGDNIVSKPLRWEVVDIHQSSHRSRSSSTAATLAQARVPTKSTQNVSHVSLSSTTMSPQISTATYGSVGKLAVPPPLRVLRNMGFSRTSFSLHVELES